MSKKAEVLTLLSGKGGSGKTVLALSMSKILHEAGLKVLLIDCDTSTHGATYFFETELNDNVLTLYDLIEQQNSQNKPLKTKSGFEFIPSILRPELNSFTDNEVDIRGCENFLPSTILEDNYDVIILDCQAGYTHLVKIATNLSQFKLIVLEPDAVSSSALRVLHLQIGSSLGRINTWQIFNKLTEEERPIYEKIFGGTLFTNLPPVPFDWQVRASFATAEIPSVISKTSAFGLGIIRSLKIIFKKYKQQIDELEGKTVGNWHEDLKKRMEELATKRKEFKQNLAASKSSVRLFKARIYASLATLVGLLISSLTFLDVSNNLLFSSMGLLIASISIVWYFSNIKELSSVRNLEQQQESLNKIESELKKFKTLMLTDPWLKEYSRNLESELKEEYDEYLDNKV